jgi:hypothetical protein
MLRNFMIESAGIPKEFKEIGTAPYIHTLRNLETKQTWFGSNYSDTDFLSPRYKHKLGYGCLYMIPSHWCYLINSIHKQLLPLCNDKIIYVDKIFLESEAYKTTQYDDFVELTVENSFNCRFLCLESTFVINWGKWFSE